MESNPTESSHGAPGLGWSSALASPCFLFNVEEMKGGFVCLGSTTGGHSGSLGVFPSLHPYGWGRGRDTLDGAGPPCPSGLEGHQKQSSTCAFA